MKGLKVKGNSAEIRVDPKVYPLEAVYSAAYVFLDKAYFILDGDPKKEIIVNLEAKEKSMGEKVAKEFLNELINYADYITRAKQTKKLRETILQRALITNDPLMLEDDVSDDFIDDPEGIAIPWEEKYGKDKAKQ